VSPITFACAAASWSISFACTSRDHGQRPMFAIDVSSMAMTAMRSLGAFDVMRTPASYAQRSSAGMKPATRAKPNRTTAMTRPTNQSAFQNAVFMLSPWPRCLRSRRGPRRYVAPILHGRRRGFTRRCRPRIRPPARAPCA
jgi:hypothetical protein